MKKGIIFVLILISNFAFGQKMTELQGDYLGQKAPGKVPVVFARGIVSTNHLEHSAPKFTNDGDQVFWSRVKLPIVEGVSGKMVMTMRRVNNRWSKPELTEHLPSFSPDGKGYYFSTSPRSPSRSISYVELQSDGSSAPGKVGILTRFPELKYAVSLTVARSGTLYFVSYLEGPLNNFGIYRCEIANGEYTKPEPLPESINKPGLLNWTPYIAPDESYLLFSSNRRDPENDAGDIFITRRTAEGTWGNPVSLGTLINSNGQERFPLLSPDGRYLFFTRPTPDHDQDVYWVDASTIDALRTPPRK